MVLNIVCIKYSLCGCYCVLMCVCVIVFVDDDIVDIVSVVLLLCVSLLSLFEYVK